MMRSVVVCLLLAVVQAADVNETVPCANNGECLGAGNAGVCEEGVCECNNGYKKAENTEVCVWVGDDLNQVKHTFMTMLQFPDAQCNATAEMVLEMYDVLWEGTQAVSNVTYRICDSDGLMVAVQVEVNLYAAGVVFGRFNTVLNDLLDQDSDIVTALMDKKGSTILSATRTAIFGHTYETGILNSLLHNCTDMSGTNTSFPFNDRCHALSCYSDYDLELNRSVTEAWPRYYSCHEEAGPLNGEEITAIVFAVLASFLFIAVVLYFGILKDFLAPPEEDAPGKDVDEKDENPTEEVQKTNEPIDEVV